MSAVEYVRSEPPESYDEYDLPHFFFGRHGDGLGDGDLLALGATVAFGLVVDLGAVVVAVVFAGVVVAGAVVVDVRTGYWTLPDRAVRVALGVTVGVAVGVGFFFDSTAVGLSLTSTLRVSCWPVPKVDGTTDSGSAWNPMTASSPVAADASATMTTLDSKGPRTTP